MITDGGDAPVLYSACVYSNGFAEGVVVSDEEAVDIDNIVDLETVRSLSPLFIDDWKKEINKLGIDS